MYNDSNLVNGRNIIRSVATHTDVISGLLFITSAYLVSLFYDKYMIQVELAI